MFPVATKTPPNPTGRRRKNKPKKTPNATPPSNTPKPQAVTRRRRRRAPVTPRTPKQEQMSGLWWLMGQFQVTSSTPTGPLELLVLHPASFPGTPYSAACQHFSHRHENSWQLSIEITTATTTGARVAVFALPDPDWNPNNIPPAMVWGAVLNGMGTMATVTGTGTSRTTFRLRTSTNRLSNATPPGSNYLGYAAAVMVIYLLEAPLALTGTGALMVTIMAKVAMKVVNPIPGFMAFTSDIQPGPGPGPAPGPTIAWNIVIKSGHQTQAIPSTWYNSHVASAWLAGGIYLRLPAGETKPTGDLAITGSPQWYTVYTCTVEAQNWHNNDSQLETPKYFVTWAEPDSFVCQIVGFATLENALNQAKKITGLIPHGVETCLVYSGTVASWTNYFTISNTGDQTIGFVQVATTEYTAPVYKDADLGSGLGPGQVRLRSFERTLPRPSVEQIYDNLNCQGPQTPWPSEWTLGACSPDYYNVSRADFQTPTTTYSQFNNLSEQYKKLPQPSLIQSKPPMNSLLRSLLNLPPGISASLPTKFPQLSSQLAKSLTSDLFSPIPGPCYSPISTPPPQSVQPPSSLEELSRRLQELKTSQDIGQRQLPSIYELPRNPYDDEDEDHECDDPMCDRCFEDDTPCGTPV